MFLHIDIAYPLPLDRSHFAFILCCYDQNSSKKQQCGENAKNGVNYEVLSANDRRNLISAQRECQTAGRVVQRECQTAGRVVQRECQTAGRVYSANVKRPAGLYSANVKRPAGLYSANVKRPAGLLLTTHGLLLI